MTEALSPEEFRRYSRHLVLPEVGSAGQMKLKTARVLIIGAGGLGSPLALYLAAAGVGTLGIVDFDAVDITNLQRQVLHSTDEIGKLKVESAREHIKKINPNIQVKTYQTRLTSENALEILANYDIIADGTDNFATRYLVNDACVLLGKPLVYGSIFRFDGQVSVFDARLGPCYRCLYPAPPPPEMAPNCAEGGVIGVLPGIIGSLQGLEVIKLILGIGEPLTGKLLLFDGLRAEFRELLLTKDPECPVCSEHPTITSLIDYEEFCGIKTNQGINMKEVTPIELKQLLNQGNDIFILDVREEWEYEHSSIGGNLIPLGTLPDCLDKIPKEKDIAVLCHHGARSARAVQFLKNNGYAKVMNIAGGIDAWSLTVDPDVPRY